MSELSGEDNDASPSPVPYRTEAMTQSEVDAAIASAPAIKKRGPLYALSFRNFRLFFVGQLISVAGTWMQTVAQQWLVWELTHKPIWLGYISGASAIPYVVFALHGGEIADRVPRRNVLVWTQVLAMLLAFVLAVLASNHPIHIQPWHIALLAGLGGIVNAYNMPAQQAFVTDMVDERDALPNAIALNSLRFNLARFVGPILAGVVLVRTNAAVCFFLNGLSFLAVIVSLLMMRLPAFIQIDRTDSIWGGFTYIRETPRVLRLVLLIGAGSIFAWSVSTLYPMLADQFHRGASGYSLLTGVNGVGAALGGVALTVLGDRLPRRYAVYGGAIMFCISLFTLSITHNFILALAILIWSGFAMIVFAITAQTRVQEEVPDDLRGRVMAVYSLVFQGLMPIGGLEIGFLAGRLGGPEAIRINALICLVIAVGLFAWSQFSHRSGPPLPSN
ncbi:MAG: Arabinose efflux permease [Chthonomonadaceae bacterium]|nr:Arabinose efflux permease [Chthonomonadaceae bacterium]